MGTCKYCGKSAGIFRSEHGHCKSLHDQGVYQIITEILGSIWGTKSLNVLENSIAAIERSSLIPSTERQALLIIAFGKAVEEFLEDETLDAAKEKRLVEFKERFALTDEELDVSGALTRMVKIATLREITGGKIPDRVNVNVNLPINFQKGEQIVWVFADSKYLEDKTYRHYVGRSQGVSVRIVKGVYYRTGAFQGRRIDEVERVYVDTGWMVVTSKNIYFAGPRKSIRLPFTKIVSFEPFSDGIGIIRDAATAKPQIFITGDGWFTYNLITNLCRL